MFSSLLVEGHKDSVTLTAGGGTNVFFVDNWTANLIYGSLWGIDTLSRGDKLILPSSEKGYTLKRKEYDPLCAYMPSAVD